MLILSGELKQLKRAPVNLLHSPLLPRSTQYIVHTPPEISCSSSATGSNDATEKSDSGANDDDISAPNEARALHTRSYNYLVFTPTQLKGK